MPFLATFRMLRPFWGMVLLMIALDQATKWAVLLNQYALPKVVIPDFFTLYLAWNNGISFSLFNSDGNWQRWVLSALGLGISLWLFTEAKRQPMLLKSLALGAVVGGALGNVLDRLVHGAVVDFLLFQPLSFIGRMGYFPTFNLADTAISCGVALFLVHEVFYTPKQPPLKV